MKISDIEMIQVRDPNSKNLPYHYNDYLDYIRQLRNYYATCFANDSFIFKEEHDQFMKKFDQNYYIAVIQNDYPKLSSDDDYVESYFTGFIGVVGDDIRFAVHPFFEGKGIGKKMLSFIKDKYPEATGKVLLDNISSQKLFEKCHFVEYKRDNQFIYYNQKK